MRKLEGVALAVLVAASPAVAAAGGRAEAGRLTIVYAADVGGYLEPCGCSQDQLGGLPRAAEVLRRIRAEGAPVLFVAGGDLLFESPPTPETRAQDELKARTLAQALRKMQLAAAVPGERDLFLGEGFLASTRLPFRRGARVGKVGFGLLGDVPPAPIRIGVVHEGGTRGALPRAEAAHQDGIALLFGSHRDSLLDDDANRAVLDAPVPVVQVRPRGQSLARVDLFLRGDLRRPFAVLPGASQRDEEIALDEHRRDAYARRREEALAAGQVELARALAQKAAELDGRVRALRDAPLPAPPSDRPSLRVSFVPLGPSLPEDREVRAIITRYYGEVARRNLAEAKASGRPCPDPRRGTAAYVGVDDLPPGGSRACQMCHPTAYEQWKGTPHARAYDTLARAKRQFDLDCIACHVTGWKGPGGPCTVAATEGRRDVQCESCHGPASLHAVDPPGHIVRDPGEAGCTACHTPENSTHFEWTAYRKRILGPGHGAPSQ